MDPAQAATHYSNLMVCSIYDQLYDYAYLARPYRIKPRLAEAMPFISEDGLTYRIQLRKGVRFADDPCFPGGIGREVTAQDFIYSLKRNFDSRNLPQGEWVWQGRIVGLDEWKQRGCNYDEAVEGLRTPGPHTLEIQLNRPYPQLTYTLAMGFASVVPREAVETYGKTFGLKPVGSGPYRLASFDTRKAVLVANPGFRESRFDLAEEGYNPETQAWSGVQALQGRKLPIMPRIEVFFMSEAMTRWNSINKGTEIQLGVIPPELTHMVAEQLNPLVLKPRYRERFTGTNLVQMEVVFLHFNMADPSIGYHPDPVQAQRNLMLRRAIRAAFDWDQRNQRFYNGIADVFPGIIPPGLEAHDPDFDPKWITTDAAQARQYLKEGGWTAENLPVLRYGGVAGLSNTQMFEQFRGWLEGIGYPREKVVLESFATFGDFSRAVSDRECMLIGMGWGLDYPDSENVLQLFYGPNQSPGSNHSNFDDPEYNRLFETAAVMQPGPERTSIYRRLNAIILDQVPSICGLARNSPYIWHRNVVFYPSRNPHGSLFQYALVLPDNPADQPTPSTRISTH
jgi:ABC-type transport system substrate-binding protein